MHAKTFQGASARPQSCLGSLTNQVSTVLWAEFPPSCFCLSSSSKIQGISLLRLSSSVENLLRLYLFSNSSAHSLSTRPQSLISSRSLVSVLFGNSFPKMARISFQQKRAPKANRRSPYTSGWASAATCSNAQSSMSTHHLGGIIDGASVFPLHNIFTKPALLPKLVCCGAVIVPSVILDTTVLKVKCGLCCSAHLKAPCSVSSLTTCSWATFAVWHLQVEDPT